MYVETNGIKLHTVIIGEGEPILLMHGFPDFGYGWKNVIFKDLKIVRSETGSHFVMDTDTETVVSNIRDFVKR
jgi:hypothetical protein